MSSRQGSGALVADLDARLLGRMRGTPWSESAAVHRAGLRGRCGDGFGEKPHRMAVWLVPVG